MDRRNAPERVSRLLLSSAALCALALSAAVGRCSPVPQSGPAPASADTAGHRSGWRRLPSGLELRVHAGTGERGWPALAWLARMDPVLHAVRVRWSESASLRAEAASELPGVDAAINANFFDPEGKAIGWAVADGREHSARAEGGWGVLSVDRAGAVRIGPARPQPDEPEAVQAVQAGPLLVVDGVANPALKRQSAPRAFAGLDPAGRLVIGVTGPVPAEATGLADFLVRAEAEGGIGLVWALNLDGGSSAQMFVRGGGPDGTDLHVPAPSAVPVLLLMERRAVRPTSSR